MSIFRNKRRKLPSSTVIYQPGADTNSLFIGWIKYLYHLIRALLIATLLGAVATSVSIFAYRLTTLGTYSLERVMDSVFKQALPSELVIYPTLITSIVFAIVFMGNGFLAEKTQEGSPSSFTKFMAGIIVILCLDILLFRINSYQIYTLRIDFTYYLETIVAQGVTVFLLLCLTPLYNKLLTKVVPPANLDIIPEKSKRIISWCWFYLVSILIVLGITYIATANISQEVDPVSLSFLNFSISILWSGAFLLSLSVALLCYWPPKYRKLGAKFGLKRLVLFLVCSISVGLIYRNLINGADIYLAVIVVAFFLMILSIPFHRSIS